MKVLFSHSYFLQLDPKQVAHAQPYPPLGTILAASLLRDNGFQVSLFDTMFVKTPEEVIPVLEAFRPDLFIIYDDGFNYLTKMCLSNMRAAAFLMQQYAKVYHCKVITTSSDASDHYEQYLENGADFVMRGEAEYTLLELAQVIEQGKKSFDQVEGLIFKALDNSIKINKPRAISKRLDDLPLPAWDLVDITPYKKQWLKHHGYFSVNIATTRGCPFKCNWCAKPIYGKTYNMRSPQNVIKEILLLENLFGMDHIWFCDDIFGLKRSWLSEFSQLVSAHDIRIGFKIQSRADLLVQEQYVTDLANSGCEEVWMGAESGSQRILDAMDKGIKVDEIKLARRLLKQHGIKSAFFIQYGYLSETMDDINLTIKLILECLPDDIGISVSYPLPGTVFYDKVKNDMLIKRNWTDSDDLSLMFSNTYSSPFYKCLYRYTHYSYRLQKMRMRKKSSPFHLIGMAKYLVLKSVLKRKLNTYTKKMASAACRSDDMIMELN